MEQALTGALCKYKKNMTVAWINLELVTLTFKTTVVKNDTVISSSHTTYVALNIPMTSVSLVFIFMKHVLQFFT